MLYIMISIMALSEADVWPIPDWQEAKPETLGVSSDGLDAYISWLSSKAAGEPYGTIVIRHGKIVLEHYGSGADRSSAWEIGSIRKAVGSSLLGMAIEDKRLSLDTIVYDIWPEIFLETGNDKDKSIKVKHLFNSSSGWKRPERSRSGPTVRITAGIIPHTTISIKRIQGP